VRGQPQNLPALPIHPLVCSLRLVVLGAEAAHPLRCTIRHGAAFLGLIAIGIEARIDMAAMRRINSTDVSLFESCRRSRLPHNHTSPEGARCGPFPRPHSNHLSPVSFTRIFHPYLSPVSFTRIFHPYLSPVRNSGWSEIFRSNISHCTDIIAVRGHRVLSHYYRPFRPSSYRPQPATPRAPTSPQIQRESPSLDHP
jgi:hypothetical protein